MHANGGRTATVRCSCCLLESPQTLYRETWCTAGATAQQGAAVHTGGNEYEVDTRQDAMNPRWRNGITPWGNLPPRQPHALGTADRSLKTAAGRVWGQRHA